MEKKQRMSEAEYQVMQAVWSADEPLTSGQVLQRLAGKSWKPTTVLTFLSRLADKGLVTCRRQGKSNLYSAAVSKQEYKRRETRSFLESLHGGSVSSFMAALYGDEEIGGDELEELKKWFSER